MMNSFMQQQQQSEVIRIPDRMVGLIIGKGGEQITAIQSESECRIQFAPADVGGFNEGRTCTLTGSPEAIEKAKELMNQIMSKGHDYPPSMGGLGGGEMNGMNNVSIQMMIPGNKAGIIIGKGGDTIKQLQEKAGVRMLIIQDSNSPTNYDKPLKITGDRDNVERAQEMVRQLLAEKDGMSGGGGGFNDYGQRQTLEIAVPRSVIGIVIGKGGEMIKKLQQDSGARIQFKPDDEMSGQDRLCSIVGTSEQIQTAASMIQEIGENSGRGGMGDSNGWRPQRSSDMDVTFGNETSFSVPADKCGLVIGKGGETIREICRLSGAHVELNREASAMSSERIFRIQGSSDQMRHAIQLVSDKAGITPGQQDGMIGGLQVASPQTQQPQQQAALAGLYAAAVQAASPTQQLYQQQQQLQQLQQLQQQQQQQLALQTSYQYPTAAYSQTAASVNSDLSKLALDSNQAVWQAYYSQVYNQMAAAGAQQSNAVAAAAASLQQQQLQSQQAHYALAGLPQQPLAAQQQSVVQPSSLAAGTGGGAADYTAAWLDYYRQQGLHQQAQALLLTQAGGAAAPTNGISLQQQPQ